MYMILTWYIFFKSPTSVKHRALKRQTTRVQRSFISLMPIGGGQRRETTWLVVVLVSFRGFSGSCSSCCCWLWLWLLVVAVVVVCGLWSWSWLWLLVVVVAVVVMLVVVVAVAVAVAVVEMFVAGAILLKHPLKNRKIGLEFWRQAWVWHVSFDGSLADKFFFFFFIDLHFWSQNSQIVRYFQLGPFDGSLRN